MAGFVSLVGAGPGDPDLLTRKAARRLREADLVLYDALVSPEVLELAGGARRFCVGKRAGRRESVSQLTIHRLMIRAARSGERVVRLKCGDPFVLGRGGEEALALNAAGVTYEVVPGITTAIAAPELEGIPVTHRGLASAFAVVSGHAESAYGPILESLAPNCITLVVLMGIASKANIAAQLLERGWRAETPAAMIFAAGTPRALSWVGSLSELAAAPAQGISDAGTIVIGDVVSLKSAAAQSEREKSTAVRVSR
jgi:uroporphyrin-III C-methyltransferase/precorrin-2 dehydrogenase/sirohydrochlorin ferrochelatase